MYYNFWTMIKMRDIEISSAKTRRLDTNYIGHRPRFIPLMWKVRDATQIDLPRTKNKLKSFHHAKYI